MNGGIIFDLYSYYIDLWIAIILIHAWGSVIWFGVLKLHTQLGTKLFGQYSNFCNFVSVNHQSGCEAEPSKCDWSVGFQLSFSRLNKNITLTLEDFKDIFMHSPWFSEAQNYLDNRLTRFFMSRCGLFPFSLFLNEADEVWSLELNVSGEFAFGSGW